MEPSVGRIVHFQPTDPGVTKPVPAIIVEVTDAETKACALHIFKRNGDAQFTDSSPFAESPTPGSWNWPPVAG